MQHRFLSRKHNRRLPVQRFMTLMAITLMTSLCYSTPTRAVTPEEFLALKISPEERRTLVRPPKHLVQKVSGRIQTLNDISKIYKISVPDLLKCNEFLTKDSVLKIGQAVYLRPLEVFQENSLWKRFGLQAFRIGDQEDLTSWELRVWMILLWNESRFNPKPFGDGDQGCSRGMGQAQMGGYTYSTCPSTGSHGICPSIPCPTDNRSLLPTSHPVYGNMTKMAPEQFHDPGIGLTASAILFKQRVHQYVSPFDAAASYAGCEAAGKSVDITKPGCVGDLLRLHKWWWVTGMDKAVLKLEGVRVAPRDQPGSTNSLASNQ